MLRSPQSSVLSSECYRLTSELTHFLYGGMSSVSAGFSPFVSEKTLISRSSNQTIRCWGYFNIYRCDNDKPWDNLQIFEDIVSVDTVRWWQGSYNLYFNLTTPTSVLFSNQKPGGRCPSKTPNTVFSPPVFSFVWLSTCPIAPVIFLNILLLIVIFFHCN